jgi:hypothetical protein
LVWNLKKKKILLNGMDKWVKSIKSFS